MQADPIQEWQRLTEHYREMSDDELRELAGEVGNLTDTAQQVLRSEMKSRGLVETQAPRRSSSEMIWAAGVFRSPEGNARGNSDPIFGDAAFGNRTTEPVPGAPAVDGETGPHEYTWKTLLCECETSAQAKQICAVLHRAGIECWIEGAQTSLGLARVLVAADQIDRARAIAANPIPQQILDDAKIEVPEFELPICPKCGASDPVLEGVDTENTWRCEQCGEQWSDSVGSEDDETSSPAE